jgi:hypothetical protein
MDTTPEFLPLTLALVNLDLPKDKKIDLHMLDNQEDVRVWFFYRGDIKLHGQVDASFEARFLAVPDYEADVKSYMSKIVLFELAQTDIISKVLFLSAAPGDFHSTVEFLRNRDIEVEVYDIAKRSALVEELKPARKPRAKSARGRKPATQAAPLAPGEKRGRGRPRKNPVVEVAVAPAPAAKRGPKKKK